MLFSSALSLLFAGIALAQTPPGFKPNATEHLEVRFGSKIVTPGLALKKEETQTIPTIGTTDAPLNGTYIFFMIDLDIPGSLVGGPAGARYPNLHCLATGYKSSTTASNGMYVLTTKETAAKPYLGPGPPPETPPYAHRYMQLLFAQPDGFKVPSSQTAAIQKGVQFNITSFMVDAKLGQPLRGNYFNVTGV